MMPDLPNVGWERDMESFREFFENPAFRTDGLKVYPTLVIRGTGLYELWKRGLYKNYPPDKVPASSGFSPKSVKLNPLALSAADAAIECTICPVYPLQLFNLKARKVVPRMQAFTQSLTS